MADGLQPTYNSEKQGKQFEDFLIVLIRWRRFIITNTLAITIVAVIFTLFIDNWYTSTASILPPKKKGGLFGDASGFSTSIKDLSKTLGRLGSGTNEAYNYLTVLQSRSASERVIDKFLLRDVYKIKKNKPVEDVIAELQDNVKFNVEEEGNITIKVSDKDPNRAAAMANFYVELLNDIINDLGTTEARSNKEFVEKRYNEISIALKDAEEKLQQFSANNNVISLEEQTKSQMQEASELKAQLSVAQIELTMLKKNYDNDNPLIQRQELLVSELNRRLSGMKYGNEADWNNKNAGLSVPFANLSKISLDYMRLSREYLFQSRLLEYLMPIYEQTKIEEKKDIPICLVLDKAIPPQRKSGPKRSIIALIAFALALFGSISFSLTANSLEDLKNDKDRYTKLQEGIFRPLRKMFFRKS
jgi:tyrosine-protein kinase Etk/Wzc